MEGGVLESRSEAAVVAGAASVEGEEAGEEAVPPDLEATRQHFSQFEGAEARDEAGGDWSFIDCEMEEIDLQDLPSAIIACNLDPRVFVDGLCRAEQESI